MTRFNIALFFLTFDTGSFPADEQEEDMDTRCTVLEWYWWHDSKGFQKASLIRNIGVFLHRYKTGAQVPFHSPTLHVLIHIPSSISNDMFRNKLPKHAFLSHTSWSPPWSLFDVSLGSVTRANPRTKFSFSLKQDAQQRSKPVKCQDDTKILRHYFSSGLSQRTHLSIRVAASFGDPVTSSRMGNVVVPVMNVGWQTRQFSQIPSLHLSWTFQSLSDDLCKNTLTDLNRHVRDVCKGHCERDFNRHDYCFLVFPNFFNIRDECLIYSRRRTESWQSPLDYAGHVEVIIHCRQNFIVLQNDTEFRYPLVVSQTSPQIQQTLFMMVDSFRLRFSCVGPQPWHSTALVEIHMHTANFELVHFSSFSPSTLSITVIT